MPNWNAGLQGAGTYGLAGFSMGGPWGAGIGAAYGGITGMLQEDNTIDVQKLLQPQIDQANQRSKRNEQLGGQLTSMGMSGLSPAMSYYKQLLSGNPASVMAATTPDRGRVIDQYDTARKAMATSGPGGGGTTSAAASSRIGQANALQEIMSTARDKGAEGASKIGSTLLSGGLQANQLASMDLNSVINAITSGAGMNIQQNQFGAGMDAAQGEAMGTMIGLMLTGKKGGLGGTGGGGGRVSSSFASGLAGSGTR